MSVETNDTIQLEHMPGQKLLKYLQHNIRNNTLYTVMIKPEPLVKHNIFTKIIPNFYDDNADSEKEIKVIHAARKNTVRKNL